MMNWILKFLPEEKKQLIVLGQRVISSLDTSEERSAAIASGIEMFKDGKVTVGEWSHFGKVLGIFKGPRA
jgi:hypothetical protein